jgi:DNA replication protein DnaC
VGNYERRFQTPVNTPLLIIDDFGLKPLRPPEDESFHDLVAECYERAATLDRLRHGAYRVVLDGDSYRSPKPTAEGSKNGIEKGGKSAHS